jgi:chemotaxis protein CheD
MKDEVSVDSGEVGACKGDGILRASAIGSCVVVTVYDPDSRVGSMAHVMLPGTSRDRDPSGGTKYAEDAMREMMRKMAALGAKPAGLCACLIGGGNVLGDGHDSPGPETVRSLAEILRRMHIEPVAMEVGGTERRSCTLDVASGRVMYTVGDSTERTLWEAKTSGSGAAEKTGRTSLQSEKEVGT